MLPDLGAFLKEQQIGGENIMLMNCRAIAVHEDEQGHALVVFTAQLDQKFMGSLIVKGSLNRISRQIERLGGTFNAKASTRADKQYVTADRQVVVPFLGVIL